jgi:hydrogenase nickel incorporation protein HypB
VGFDRALALANLRAAAPGARLLEVSARTGAGLDAWYDLLRELAHRKSGSRAKPHAP